MEGRTDIETILASPVSAHEPEELLARAVADHPKQIRVALRLARIFALPERGASRAEILDFEVMLWPLRSEFPKDPVASFELSEVCRNLLNLEKIADVICSKLSEATQSEFREPMWFVMVDLAVWHAGRGELAEARRLWQRARAPKLQDHRLHSRFYSWRFDHEPGPAEDKLCMCKASPPIMRPLLGPERHCPCSLIPADCTLLDRELLPGSEEALSEKLAFDEQVRRVLDRRYNLEGSFANGDTGDPAGDVQNEAILVATKEAKAIVWGRRFKVRIVDEKNSDGVAADAQHRQNRAEESRLKVRGLTTGSEFSSTQSSEVSQTSGHEVESSDDNSDLYFNEALPSETGSP